MRATPRSTVRPCPAVTACAVPAMVMTPDLPSRALFHPGWRGWRATSISKNEVAAGGSRRHAGDVRQYGQYCPIARSSEVLAERWTPIIVRNLLNGCHTFSEIRQGAARDSHRLAQPETRNPRTSRGADPPTGRSGRGFRYELTPMGQELRVVFDAMGQWGAKWLEI